MSYTREVKELVKTLRKLGWTVTLRRAGHYQARSPDKRIPLITFAATPSCSHACKNMRALFRRHGVPL